MRTVCDSEFQTDGAEDWKARLEKSVLILLDSLVEASFRFLNPSAVTKFQGEPPHQGAKYTGDRRISQLSLFILEIVQDRPMVAMDL